MSALFTSIYHCRKTQVEYLALLKVKLFLSMHQKPLEDTKSLRRPLWLGAGGCRPRRYGGHRGAGEQRGREGNQSRRGCSRRSRRAGIQGQESAAEGQQQGVRAESQRDPGRALRRGNCGEPRASPLPAAQRMREPPGAGGGAGTKFPETRVVRGPDRPVPPATRSHVGTKCRPPAASRPGPRAPYQFGRDRG